MNPTKQRKLVIISHTEHVLENGKVYGWGPTINEINELANHWEQIIHVACLHQKTKPKSAEPYSHNHISFVPIPPFGGKTIMNKLGIVWKAPQTIVAVIRAIRDASEVQLRLPTGIGLYLLPLFSFFIPRKFTLWVKYAGDWSAADAPLTFRMQRWWLKKNITRCKVTINGFWPNQPKHCLSFENPCLFETEIAEGATLAQAKKFAPPFNLIFVGRIEHAKGLQRIVDALQKIPKHLINRVDIIGDGADQSYYTNEFSKLEFNIVMHGFLTKPEIIPLLKTAHFVLLPSDSEGFPKVIAEGACYGCIPVVSDVSSIGHYVNDSNGFLWTLHGPLPYAAVLNKAIIQSANVLGTKSQNLPKLAAAFTHEHYFSSLQSFIFNT